jgi:serine/threonine protein phosphatase PrpC
MSTLSFNTDFTVQSFSNQDVLSVFKQTSEKNMEIQQGMSVKEISEIVSEKIIAVVREQFEVTKTQFENKEQK